MKMKLFINNIYYSGSWTWNINRNSSVRSKHMDLLRENSESEDLLMEEEPQRQFKE